MTRRILHPLPSYGAVLLAVLIASPPAMAQYDEVAYGSAFTDGIDWTLDGLWAVDSYPVQGTSPPNSLNYNNASGFIGGPGSGTARSPVVDAGQAGWLHLHFACRYAGASTRRLRIIDWWGNSLVFDGPMGAGPLACGSMNQWHVHTLDLPADWPRVLQFEFIINTVDANSNGSGWFIDNFIIHIEDLMPPDAITDLSAQLLTKSIARLTWTSPWDRLQGLNPGAAFDLRYSTTPITEETWYFSSMIHDYSEPTPGDPGTQHTYDVYNLVPGQTYYFAIRTWDVAGNESALSNIAVLTTMTPPPAGSYATAGSSGEGSNSLCSAGTAAGSAGVVLLGAFVLLAAARSRHIR